MKAVLCKQHGLPDTLVLEDVPEPVPGPGQVVIAVHAAGVNFPDVLMIQGAYQRQPDLPFTPGCEVSGTVLRVGEGVTTLRVGDRVVSPVGSGGFGQQALAEVSRVIPIPPEMDFESASGLVMTYGTSHHALKDRGQLKPGETLLVLGAAGGVGLAAVEIGKAMGARVIAAASTDDKLEVCRQHGADELINYSRDDLRKRLKELVGDRGVDMVYDPVGGTLSEQALRSMAWNGRFLVIGFAAGTIPSIPLNLPLLKGCAIVGVFWGTFTRKEPERNAANMVELFDWYRRGVVQPHICARYPLEQTVQALNDVMNRAAKGKVIVTVAQAD